MNASMIPAAGLAAVLLAAGAAMGQITIETVSVGNPGNAADTEVMWSDGTAGYGSVDYEFNIGKYEVMAGQYTAFLNAVAGTDTYDLYHTGMSRTDYGSGISRNGSGTPGDPYTYTVDPAFVNRPVSSVTWGDAARFANWLHNGQPTGAQDLTTTEDGAYYLNGAMSKEALLAVTREADWKWAIPTEDEWYKAAYYDPVTVTYYNYPTGSNSVPGRDMSEATNPGNNTNYYGTPYPIDSPYYKTVGGEFELSASPYGTSDQGGNVWEWNEAVVNGNCRGMRGGSYEQYDYSMHAALRYYLYPTFGAYYTFGFRIAAAAPDLPGLPGDADLDGDVDFLDYQALESGFGATTGAVWAMGDFDLDGDVDFDDYQALETNFGESIPEPGTLALLVLGGLALLRRCRGFKG